MKLRQRGMKQVWSGARRRQGWEEGDGRGDHNASET